MELDKEKFDKAMELVWEERKRQHSLHGHLWTSTQGEIVILGEEFGELCRAVNDNGNIEEEAIHVAAVAVKLLERLV